MKFYANRFSTSANTDFDIAMTSVQLGPFETSGHAQQAIVNYLWAKEDAERGQKFLLEMINDPEGSRWEVENLVWLIRKA